MPAQAILRALQRSRWGQAFRAGLLRDLRAEMPPPVDQAALAERAAALAVSRIEALLRRTGGDHAPQAGPVTETWRDLEHVRLDVKVLGSLIARQLHEAAALGRADFPAAPVRVGLTSKLCVQADIHAEWLGYWCGQLRMARVYHRKLWEDCFVMQALWEADMLDEGREGLGFAVGRERIPSILARDGVRVLATDLPAADQRAAGWQRSNEHAADLRVLHDPTLCDWETFDRRCRFMAVDMNDIPADLRDRFDFCWSVCSFEHLGSVEKGLAFVANSVRCLKPGGVAVHTTEYNLSNGGETIDNHETVLFNRGHIERLGRELAAQGHRLLPVDFSTGTGPLDSFVDIPPFPQDGAAWDMRLPETPHLRLSVDGFAATSIGLIVRRGVQG